MRSSCRWAAGRRERGSSPTISTSWCTSSRRTRVPITGSRICGATCPPSRSRLRRFPARLGRPGAVAQLGERRAGSAKVTGSSPVGSTPPTYAPLTPQRRNHNATFAILAVGGISYALLQSLVAPALPDLQRALHTSESSVSWVLTAYLLSASVATPLIGRLGDMYGKERVLMIVLALLSVGTVVSALASSLPLMLVGRVIQGAAGGIFPLAFGIIRDEFPRERVAGAIGLMSALLGVGGGAGVVLAGPIVDNLSFHYLFWLPLILIVGVTLLTH